MSKKLFLVVFLFSLFIFHSKTFANLYINEFYPATSDSDWVEIYNSSDENVDLSSYLLRDSSETNKIELSGVLSGKSFAIFDWSNKLNNSGDTIKLLLKSDGSEIDRVIYGSSGDVFAPGENQTAGRNPDGSSNIVVFSSSSKGSSNNSSFSLPSPTSTPTPTSKPSPSPVPTKTPKPTPTTKTNSPTPVKSNSPTQPQKTGVVTSESKNLANIPTSILGEATESSISETPAEEKLEDIKTLGESQSNLPLIIIFSGSIIFIFCGILAYFIIKRRGNKNDET